MSKAEYWLLNLVVIGWWPLEALLSDDLELHVNGPGHGLAPPELANVLHGLFPQGYIIASDSNGADFVPTAHQLEQALAGEGEQIHYGLTPQGGAAWESMAHPNWNYSIWADISRQDEGEISIYGSSRRLAEQGINVRMWCWGQLDTSSSPVWEVLSAWQATYWKALDVGYRVCIRVCEVDEEAMDDAAYDAYVAREQQGTDWEIEINKKWYTPPW